MGRKLTVSDLLQDVRRKVTDFIMESFLPSPTEPTILPLSDTFLPYVTVRSGGVSLRALKELLFARTMKSVDSLLELETANTRDRKIAVASLERLIGEISATSPVRNELIHLKRDVFNDRLTSTALSIDAESEMTRRLSIEESSSLLEWFDKRAQREETEIEARTAFTEELSRNSAKLSATQRKRRSPSVGPCDLLMSWKPFTSRMRSAKGRPAAHQDRENSGPRRSAESRRLNRPVDPSQ